VQHKLGHVRLERGRLSRFEGSRAVEHGGRPRQPSCPMRAQGHGRHGSSRQAGIRAAQAAQARPLDTSPPRGPRPCCPHLLQQLAVQQGGEGDAAGRAVEQALAKQPACKPERGLVVSALQAGQGGGRADVCCG